MSRQSRIALFFGTRPQVIKASVLRDALRETGVVTAIDSGQHYDYAMHAVHYEQLGILPSDIYLGVGSGSHAEQTGALLGAASRYLTQHHPDLVVVIGDTNTTLACALAAAKMRIPVAHVEAGMRARDQMMAEEINRRCVDAMSSLLFAPSAAAERALQSERLAGLVSRVGDVAYDVLCKFAEKAPRLDDLTLFQPNMKDGYIFVTLHRAELVDDPGKLRAVVTSLARLTMPVVFAAHPRTAAAIERLGIALGGHLRVLGPVGYLESLTLTRNAKAAVTDSGGLQREAYWLGVPCITVRDETEWTETVDLGANRLISPSSTTILDGAIESAWSSRNDWDRSAYGDGRAAVRIASDVRSFLAGC